MLPTSARQRPQWRWIAARDSVARDLTGDTTARVMPSARGSKPCWTPSNAVISSGWAGRALPVIRFSFLAALAVAVCSAPAAASPPYRSTDAGTADPWVFEARLGLLRLRRDRGDTLYSSPLLRLNFGLPRGVELISELDVRLGLHVGVTAAAPDMLLDAWTSTAIAFRR